jgi:predicted RNase H-like HicB family nuclease
MRYAVVIEEAGENFSAYVLDLPGCVATGKTPGEAQEAIREAIGLHLQGLKEDGEPMPAPSSRVEYIEVAA